MPEGDTIFRAARTLDRALAGRTVTRFQSVLPQLTRVEYDRGIGGRVIDRVSALGKHLLVWFSGGLILRTHLRMHGSWHIYRPGERWQRPFRDMRIVIGTDAFEAIAFNVPVAELLDEATLAQEPALAGLGPDPLAGDFDDEEAIRRLRDRAEMEAADAILDQRAIAGVGNVFKSEILFVSRVNPFTPVGALPDALLETIVRNTAKLMQANIHDTTGDAVVTYTGFRRTTGRADTSARFWVYGRAGEPCRRCGTRISRAKQGPYARSTYWCQRCQPSPGS